MDELKLNQPIKVKDCNGVVREGVIKGMSLGKDDELNITVEYLTPVRNTFTKDNIITE